MPRLYKPELTELALTSNAREATLRAELRQLQARYDGGAVEPAVYAVMKRLEADIAWEVHRRGC